MKIWRLDCAVGWKDLIAKFNSKRLITDVNICKKYGGKRSLVYKIFFYAFKMIIMDIIENSITFDFRTQRPSYLHMARTSGEEFKKAVRNGAWQDVDYMASDFSGYNLEYVIERKFIPKRCKVYISHKYKDIITQHTNEGKQYF